MFEESTITPYEWYWIYYLVLAFVIPGTVMLIDHSRGYFMLTYSFIFIVTISWNLCHGWSDIDDQVLWANVASAWLGVSKKELPGSKKLYAGGRRCMFVKNHTSMADLFLMDVVLEGRCSYLARYGVIIF